MESDYARGESMEDWKSQPLGFALVDQAKSGNLLIHHVSIREEGVFFTGLWSLNNPDSKIVQDRLTHWLITGTRDGMAQIEAVLGENIHAANLAGLVTACEKADKSLNEIWQEYRDEEPRKRANLKPLAARTWPMVGEDGEAAKILKRVGRSPFPQSAPNETRDILALANLVSYVIETWYDLETDRLSRKYLQMDEDKRHLYPPEWLNKHRPYWPKADTYAV